MGRMGTTKHAKVLSALEQRAERYRSTGQLQVDPDDRLYEEAVDETGTVETASLTGSESESDWDGELDCSAKMMEEMEVLKVDDDLLRVHGQASGAKAEGTTRVIYENADGF